MSRFLLLFFLFSPLVLAQTPYELLARWEHPDNLNPDYDFWTGTPTGGFPYSPSNGLDYIAFHEQEQASIIAQGIALSPPQYWDHGNYSLYNDTTTQPSAAQYAELSSQGVDVESTFFVVSTFEQLQCPHDQEQWTRGHSTFCVPTYDNGCPAGTTQSGGGQCFPDITAAECQTYSNTVGAINYAWLTYSSGATYCELYFDLDQDGEGDLPTNNSTTNNVDVDVNVQFDAPTGLASNDCEVAPVCSDGSAECALLHQTWYSMCAVVTVVDAGNGSGSGSGGGGDPVYENVIACIESPFPPGTFECTGDGLDSIAGCGFDILAEAFICDADHTGEGGTLVDGGGSGGSGGSTFPDSDGDGIPEFELAGDGPFTAPVPTSMAQVDAMYSTVSAEYGAEITRIRNEASALLSVSMPSQTCAPNVNQVYNGADVDFSLCKFATEIDYVGLVIYGASFLIAGFVLLRGKK